jgi:hypothetical protein
MRQGAANQSEAQHTLHHDPIEEEIDGGGDSKRELRLVYYMPLSSALKQE